MRFNSCEKDLPFCYQPQYCGLWAAQHGELFYSYHAETRRDGIERAAAKEPAAALAAECCGAMGLFSDCAEMLLLAAVMENLPQEDRAWLRGSMPQLAGVVRGREALLKKMYFSWILPVVAAFDAGEGELAGSLLMEGARRLEKEQLPHS